MKDPFGEQRGKFKYGELLRRLKSIKEKVENKNKKMDLENPNIDDSQSIKSNYYFYSFNHFILLRNGI